MRDVVNASCLGLSMMAGAVVTVFVFVNPLAHGGEDAIWFNGAATLAGLILGGMAWKAYQGSRGQPPGDIPPV